MAGLIENKLETANDNAVFESNVGCSNFLILIRVRENSWLLAGPGWEGETTAAVS